VDDIFAGPQNPLFTDVNNNGLDDAWETAYGLSLSSDNRSTDSDGDGFSTIQEYIGHTSPIDYYNGALPIITSLVIGNQPGPDGLVSVKITRASDGAPLVNAPVTFTVSGANQISATAGGVLSAQVAVRTDSLGVARVYLVFSASPSEVVVATAQSGAQSTALSIPVSAPFTVTNGMRLWLKADTGVIADSNSNISQWQDQSGLGNTASQTTVANQPQLVTNQLNSRPVTRFNGGLNQWLDLPNFMGGAPEGEMFIVLMSAVEIVSNYPKAWRLGNASDGGSYPALDGHIVDDFGTNDPKDAGDPVPPLTQFNVYNPSAKAGAWKARFNGSQIYETTINTVNFSSSPRIGRGGGSAWSGDIAEVIIYNRVLTSQEREAVGNYLANKYALNAVMPTPANLSATVVSSTQVSLQWNDAQIKPGNTYTVERQLGSGNWTTAGEVTDAQSFIDQGLTAATTYDYRVRGRSFGGSISCLQ